MIAAEKNHRLTQKIFLARSKQTIEDYEINSAICIHRVDSLQIGDMAVWVGVNAAHRDAAFQACRFVIDETKICVPIWKKEFYLDSDDRPFSYLLNSLCLVCKKKGYLPMQSN